MDFLEIRNILDSTQKLPGWDIQKKMAPPTRGDFTWEEIYENNPRESAVVILIYKKGDRLFFPLILRSIYEGIHSGQIGLPGGKRDNVDASLEDTALRESFEELGVERKKQEIIKKISPLYIPPSNFYVQPYISFYKEEKIKFEKEQSEVQQVYEIDLSKFLLKSEEITQKQISLSYINSRVPAFDYEGITIWGATAMILNEFRYLFKNSNTFAGL